MADDELWHVRISADEVKTLTLEQIDDLYRLDVIDADTQLWQDGMDEWLPLRVVAGLDEEEVVNISVPPPSMPPAKLGNTMSWPPPAVAGPSPANSSWPPPVSRSAPPSARSVPPAPSSRPVPPSMRPNPAAFASTVPTWPPGAPPSKSSAPAGLFSPSTAPDYSVPASIRPQVVAEPYNYPRPTNPMPIVLAAIVGLTVTLYRNDVLHAGARTVGQEANYLKLEQALGGPGFGTPRAVEPMAKAAAALAEIAPLPMPTSTSTSDSSSSTSSSRDSSTTSTTPKPTATATPEAKKATAPMPQPQSATRPAVARPEADTPNPVFKQPKGAKKAKGNEFDPLNPSL